MVYNKTTTVQVFLPKFLTWDIFVGRVVAVGERGSYMWSWVWQTYLLIFYLKFSCNKCNCEWKDKGTIENYIAITTLPLTTKHIYLGNLFCRGGGEGELKLVCDKCKCIWTLTMKILMHNRSIYECIEHRCGKHI